MSPLVIGVVVILLILIGLGVLLLLREGTYADIQAVNRAWSEVATRSRLKYTRPESTVGQAELAGTFRQREMSVRVRAHATIGAQGQPDILLYTHLQTRMLRDTRYYVRFASKGRYRKTDRYLGTPVVRVGDPEIDGRFDVKSIPADTASKALTASPEFRERLLAVKTDGYVELEIENTQILFEHEGLVTDAKSLYSLVEMISACASVLEKIGS